MNRESKVEGRMENDFVPRNENDEPVAANEPPAEPTEPLEPHQLTREEIEDLKAQASKAQEYWDQLLRTAADFDNFKKRAARERHDASRYANEALLQKLIPVLDNFDAAVAAAANNEAPSVGSLQTGIAMIYQQLKNILAETGLEEIDATNKTFDPNWHEALSQRETTEVPEGQVIQQLRKGYKLRDRLLRPAGVVVAKKPAAKSSA